MRSCPVADGRALAEGSNGSVGGEELVAELVPSEAFG
jgi:hypothetical protein